MARGVDLSIPNSILQAFLSGQQIRRQREQDALAEEETVVRRKERENAAKEGIRRFNEQIQEDRKRNEALRAHQKTTEDLQRTEAAANFRQRMLQNISSGIENVPQDQMVAPGLSKVTTGPTGLPTEPILETPELERPKQVSFQNPYTNQQESINAVYPEDIQQRALNFLASQERVKLPFKMAEAEALAERQFGLEDFRQKGRERITQAQLASREAEGEKNRANRLQAASLRDRATGIADTTIADNFLPEFIDATATLEELPKSALGVKIRNRLSESGFRMLKKQEKANLEGLALVNRIYQRYVKLKEAMDDAGTLALINPAVRTLEKENEADLGLLARAYASEVGVLTQKDIERVGNLKPSAWTKISDKFGTEEANVRRLNELKEFFNEKARVAKGTLKPEQDAIITEKFKLTLPDLPAAWAKKKVKDGVTFVLDKAASNKKGHAVYKRQ